MRSFTIDRRVLRVKDLNKWMKVRLFSQLLESDSGHCFVYTSSDVKEKLRQDLDQECIDQIATSGLKDLIRVLFSRFSDVQLLGILKNEKLAELIYDLDQETVARIYKPILDEGYPIDNYTISSIVNAVGLEPVAREYWDMPEVKRYLLNHGDTEESVKDILAMELLQIKGYERLVFEHLREMYKASKLDIRRRD
jgi:hypothetical protein